MIELGLCCAFKEAPIRFRSTTATYLKRCPDPIKHLNSIVEHNVQSLHQAIEFCKTHNIAAFRINSRFLPSCTHPDVAYTLNDLPDGKQFKNCLKKCKDIRLSFHPDQFILLSSPKEHVTENSIKEIEYQSEIAELVGADVINIHGGGAYDSKEKALDRFYENFFRLSKRAQKRLTIENDDKIYTPKDLLPLCHRLKIPLVYDVHHHRCNPDGLSIESATSLALETWDRYPQFHISSPKAGWASKTPSKHADYIDIRDVPKSWIPLKIQVDVEAKAKELAVLKLQKELLNY
jgi:UV DNA damage endonuclease